MVHSWGALWTSHHTQSEYPHVLLQPGVGSRQSVLQYGHALVGQRMALFGHCMAL